MSVLVQDTITTLAAGGRSVGVDAGTTTLLTLSTGQKVPNLRHERADRVRLAKAQRLHARKQKGSSNRGRARLKVGKVYARIAERRRDYLHKVTTGLVRENQTTVIEDLAAANMVGSHSLARAISDAPWRDLRAMLEYKRLVWARAGGRGPLVPVVQGVFGVRASRRVDAPVGAGMGVHQLWRSPRPGRERCTEHQIRGALGDRLRTRNETDPTLVGDASVETSLLGRRNRNTRP